MRKFLLSLVALLTFAGLAHADEFVFSGSFATGKYTGTAPVEYWQGTKLQNNTPTLTKAGVATIKGNVNTVFSDSYVKWTSSGGQFTITPDAGKKITRIEFGMYKAIQATGLFNNSTVSTGAMKSVDDLVVTWEGEITNSNPLVLDWSPNNNYMVYILVDYSEDTPAAVEPVLTCSLDGATITNPADLESFTMSLNEGCSFSNLKTGVFRTASRVYKVTDGQVGDDTILTYKYPGTAVTDVLTYSCTNSDEIATMENGEYELTIFGGDFNMDNGVTSTPNQVLRYRFTVDFPAKVADPELTCSLNGTITDPAALDSFTLTLNDGYTFTELKTGVFRTASRVYKVTDGKVGDDTILTYKYPGTAVTNVLTYNCTSSDDIATMENGEYDLTIPVGDFQISNGSTSTPNETLHFRFTVDFPAAEPVTPEITVAGTPENGATVESIESISFTFNGNSYYTSDNSETSWFSITKDGEPYEHYTFWNASTVWFQTRGGGSVITAPGTYVFSAKEGLFDVSVGGKSYPSPAFDWTLTIPAPEPPEMTYTFNPEKNATIASLSEISFTVNGETPVLAENADTSKCMFKLDGVDVAAPSFENGKIVFPDEIITAGQLYVYVPAGVYNVTLDGNTWPCPDIQMMYTLTGKSADLEYEFNPANGSTVESIPEFTFTINGVTPELTNYNSIEQYSFKRDDAVIDFGINFRNQPRLSNGKVLFPAPLTDAGVYTFHIDANVMTVTIGGKTYDCPAMDYTLTICGGAAGNVADVTFSTTPAAGVKADAPVEQVSVKFNTTEEISFTENLNTLMACNIVYNDKTLTYGTDFTEDEEDITTLVFEAPLTEEGTVTVNIPEGFYTIGGLNAPAVSWSFTIGAAKVELPAVTYTLTPANGSTYKGELSELKINFDNTVESVKVIDTAKYSASIVINNSTKYRPYFTLDETDPTIIKLSEPIAEDAVVKVIFDEGIYELTRTNGDVVKSPAITADDWTFNVTIPVVLPALTYTFSPANGSTFDGDLSELKINFDNTVESVKVVDTAKYSASIVINNATKYRPYFSFDTTDPTIIKLSEPITTEATVKVIFDEGIFEITRTNGDVVMSPAITADDWTFNVVPAAPKVAYTVTPAENDIISKPLEGFSVKFDTTEEISFSDNMAALLGCKVTYNGKTLSYTDGFNEGDEITDMIFDEPLAESGVVTVTIPAGFYMIGENESPAISWSFQIKIKEPSVYTMTPADGTTVNSVEGLLNLTITIPDGYRFGTLQAGWLQSGRYLYFEDTNGTRTQVLTYKYNNEGVTNELVYTAQNYDATKTYEDGKYVFVLPKNAFTYGPVDGMLTNSEAEEYVYTVDKNYVGVNSAVATDSYTVYTMTGFRVLNNANADALRQLTPGMYIVNGKKVVIK